MFLVGASGRVGDHVPIQPDRPGDRIERLARNDLRAQLREKSLLPVGKFDIKIVRCHGFDHGIAQKLEPFIVDLPSVG